MEANASRRRTFSILIGGVSSASWQHAFDLEEIAAGEIADIDFSDVLRNPPVIVETRFQSAAFKSSFFISALVVQFVYHARDGDLSADS